MVSGGGGGAERGDLVSVPSASKAVARRSQAITVSNTRRSPEPGTDVRIKRVGREGHTARILASLTSGGTDPSESVRYQTVSWPRLRPGRGRRRRPGRRSPEFLWRLGALGPVFP